MASQQRIKGQECQIIIVSGGILQDTLTNIMNFNFEMVSETKEQGYLGGTNDLTDDVFKNVKFDFEMHSKSQEILTFVEALRARQQRKDPNLVINISAVLFYPNGDTPSIIIPDAKFGSIPWNIGARGDYVKTKFQGIADNYQIQRA